MKKLVILLLTIFVLAVVVGPVDAQNKNATGSAGRKSQAAQRAKERIENLKDKQATRAAQVREKTRDKFRRRAHVLGEITGIDGATIIIQTRKEDTKSILTDEETKYFQIGQGGKKKITFADLKVGNRIAAVGIAKDENSGTAKFIVKFARPTVKRHAVFGEVSESGNNTLTVTHLIHTDKLTTTVNVNADTKIKIKGKENATFADIKVGDKVAASGTVDDKGVITAKRVFVIPGKFEGAKPKGATESATPSSSTE